MTTRENHVITITSDWGIKDHYLAIVKGQLLLCCPNATIVDISHSIQPFNTFEAAFVLKKSYFHFPKGSWHVVEVSSGISSNAPYLIVKYRDHFFIGHDDGVFSLIFDEKNPDEIFEINDPPETLFPMRDIYIPVLSQLLQGVDINNIAHPISSISKKTSFKPTISLFEDKNKVIYMLTGQVVYVDNYENIFTNISRSDYENARNNISTFNLHIGGGSSHPKLQISNNFKARNASDVTVLFIDDYLVIALEQGNAAGLLGGSLEDSILLEFIKEKQKTPE